MNECVFRRSSVTGRLGVRITQTPSGVYVESVEGEDRGQTEDRFEERGHPGSETDSGVSVGDKVVTIEARA